MKLTLCMIVKNEQADLARCVGSVTPIIDDLVIVDTGSDDNTVDVAESLGARVYHHGWTDDFSAARNAALGHVEEGWALCLDADEMIAPLDHPRIRALIDDDRVDGYYLVQRHYLKGPGYVNQEPVVGEYPQMERGFSSYSQNYAMRLYRKRPDYVYTGRVHENLVCQNPATRWITAKTGVVIHHYGKSGDRRRLEGKMKEYLKLGELKAEEAPGDPKPRFELGVQLHELGRFEECIGFFTEAFELDRAYSKSLFYIGSAHYKLGRPDEARRALEEMIRIDPAHADALVNLAGVERQEGNVDKAITLFDRAIEVNGGMFAAWFNKGALLSSEGRFAQAEPCFAKAIELDPDHAPAMFGHWQCLVFTSDYHQAGREMVEWLKRFPGAGELVDQAVAKYLSMRKFDLVVNALAPLVATIDNARSYAALGAAQLGVGDIDNAEMNLEKALELDENDVDARVNLAQLKEVCRHDYQSAVTHYEQALNRCKDHKLCVERLSALRLSE